MLAVAAPKRNKLQNIIVLTPKDGMVKAAAISLCSKLVAGMKHVTS